MGSDGTVGANKEAVKIIANQEHMSAQVRQGPRHSAAAWRRLAGARRGR